LRNGLCPAPPKPARPPPGGAPPAWPQKGVGRGRPSRGGAGPGGFPTFAGPGVQEKPQGEEQKPVEGGQREQVGDEVAPAARVEDGGLLCSYPGLEGPDHLVLGPVVAAQLGQASEGRRKARKNSTSAMGRAISGSTRAAAMPSPAPVRRLSTAPRALLRLERGQEGQHQHGVQE